jgi:hypothetical protein
MKSIPAWVQPTNAHHGYSELITFDDTPQPTQHHPRHSRHTGAVMAGATVGLMTAALVAGVAASTATPERARTAPRPGPMFYPLKTILIHLGLALFVLLMVVICLLPHLLHS